MTDQEQRAADKLLAGRIVEALYDDDVVLATVAEGELSRHGATWAVQDAIASVRRREVSAQPAEVRP